jgi:hypothetical protein
MYLLTPHFRTRIHNSIRKKATKPHSSNHPFLSLLPFSPLLSMQSVNLDANATLDSQSPAQAHKFIKPLSELNFD